MIENETVTGRSEFAPTDLLDDDQLAEVLHVTPQYVRTSRMRDPKWDGPPWMEISPKVKRYLWSDVLEWLEARRKHPAKRRSAA